jgi:hypothetical protein
MKKKLFNELVESVKEGGKLIRKNTVTKTPIICPCCKQESGYTQEDCMFLDITIDLLCKHCGEIVAFGNIVW